MFPLAMQLSFQKRDYPEIIPHSPPVFSSFMGRGKLSAIKSQALPWEKGCFIAKHFI